MSRGGRRLYAQMSAADRAAAEDVLADLHDVAVAARLEGWARWELPEIVYAEARARRVWIWPTAVARIVAEVR